MRLNQFSARVVGGRETSGGYVEMQHSQKYSLSLRNDRNVRCDARVVIDGKHVGTWRIEAHRNIVLERPADDDGCFTFYRAGSKKGAKAGIVEGDPNNGLVVVTFTPEIRITPIVIRYHHYRWPNYPPYPWPWRPSKPQWERRDAACYVSSVSVTASVASCDMRQVNKVESVASQYQAGGTGLSGKSDQKFITVGSICYDYSQQTTISLRLVKRRKKQEEPRPLVAQGNPVPPPV